MLFLRKKYIFLMRKSDAVGLIGLKLAQVLKNQFANWFNKYSNIESSEAKASDRE